MSGAVFSRMDGPRTVLAQNWQGQLRKAFTATPVFEDRKLFRELNPDLEYSPIVTNPQADPKVAAILVPIINRPEGPTVLFTLRSADMPSHAGQISFPGGRQQAEDENLIATALRETEEEVGIPANAVDVVGQFGVHFGGRGYAVTPVVGIVHPGAAFTPCPREVAEIFEVPLTFLADSQNHIIEHLEYKETPYRMFAVPFDGWRIWGLTAGIVHSLAQVVSMPHKE